MAIKIKFENDLNCPVIFCDACGEPIRDSGTGAYVYDGTRTNANNPGEVFFVHKGKCHEAIDKRVKNQGGHPSWNTLNSFLVFLLRNLGVKSIKDFKELKRKVDQFYPF